MSALASQGRVVFFPLPPALCLSHVAGFVYAIRLVLLAVPRGFVGESPHGALEEILQYSSAVDSAAPQAMKTSGQIAVTSIILPTQGISSSGEPSNPSKSIPYKLSYRSRTTWIVTVALGRAFVLLSQVIEL